MDTVKCNGVSCTTTTIIIEKNKKKLNVKQLVLPIIYNCKIFSFQILNGIKRYFVASSGHKNIIFDVNFIPCSYIMF